VQSNHATRGITSLHPQGEGIPNIVLIGVPDVDALNRVLARLEAAGIPHYCWSEPDNNMGFTAIATTALGGDERQVLRNYRLWKYERGAAQAACGFKPDSLTMSRGLARQLES